MDITSMRRWCLDHGFIDDTDYKSLHLNWLSTHQSFVPEMSVWSPMEGARFNNYVLPSVTYKDVMVEVYSKPEYTQEWAFYNLRRDIDHHRANTVAIEKIMLGLSKNYEKTYFVTIGFNHQTYEPRLFKAFIASVMSFDWILKFKAKFEIFRSNGMHPHCHMKIETALPKSKIIEKLMRAKSGKILILKKEFIDVKPFGSHHELYLDGNKTDEKMVYVEQDKLYRSQYDIDQVYER